jgi:hypothetical protein
MINPADWLARGFNQMHGARIFSLATRAASHRSTKTGRLKISPDCPKQWLVILHIELNPDVVGL